MNPLHPILEQPVGRGAPNQAQDLQIVKNLLGTVSSKLHGLYFQAPPATGCITNAADIEKTIQAIAAFQKEILGFTHPDGRVDPSGTTFHALKYLSSSNLEKLFTRSEGVTLNPQLRKRVLCLIAHVGPAVVNSAVRSLEVQAKAMSTMTDRQLEDLYGKGGYVAEMERLGPGGNESPRPVYGSNGVLDILRRFFHPGGHPYISHHLAGKAVDISERQLCFGRALTHSSHKPSKFGLKILQKKGEKELHCLHCELIDNHPGRPHHHLAHHC